MWLPLFLSASIVLAPAIESPETVERRLLELQLRVESTMKDAAWDEALAIVREMAAIDAEHPKVQIQAVLVHRSSGRMADAPLFLDGLASFAGPGRVYASGLIHFFSGRIKEARTDFVEALERYRSIGHRAGEAASHAALGNVAFRNASWDEAAAEYELARGLLLPLGDRQGLADLVFSLGNVEMKRGAPGAALERHHEALAIREEMGLRAAQGQSWFAIGQCLAESGRRAEAIDAFGRSLALRVETRDERLQTDTLQEIAKQYAADGRWDPAASALAGALDAATRAGDRKREANVMRQLGDTFLDAGRDRDAIASLERAAELYGELADARSQARALAVLGKARFRRGDPGRARKDLEGAIEIARKAGDTHAEAAASTSLGNVELSAGDFAGALVHEDRALVLHRELKDAAGEQSNLGNLGGINFLLGRIPRARQYLEEALRAAEKSGNAVGIAQARHNLGVLLAEEGRGEEAVDQLRAAVAVWDPVQRNREAARGRADLAEVLLGLGRLDEAGEELRRSFDLIRAGSDPLTEARARNVEGELFSSRGQPDAAARSHRKALVLAERSGNPDEQWRAHAGLAASFEARGDLAEAARQSLLAIDAVERTRAGLVVDELKLRFFAGKADLFESALRRTVGAGSTAPGGEALASAFQLSERARARGLLDLLAQLGEPLRAKLDPGLREREREERDALAGAIRRLASAPDRKARKNVRAEVDTARDGLERLQLELHRRAPQYAAVAFPRAASMREAQAGALEQGEVLLEYFVGRETAWLFVVDRERASIHPLRSPREIATLVDALRKAVSAPVADLAGRSDDFAAAEDLARALLPSINLPAGARILVAPDGPLHGVPFDALRVDGKFLCESHEVVVVPSATALGLTRRQPDRVADDGFLGVGDPTGDAGGLDRLPFSREEVNSIAALFPEAHRTILVGAAATKSNLGKLALDRYRFVHFATHGWFDAENPRNSGLRLAGGDGTDESDLLSVDEILRLTLTSEVVVLSACGSGLGELVRGEGFVGLTRSFLYAGSRSVVAGLWDVGDRPAAELMTEFYRFLRGGDSPSAALRRAKMEFLASSRPERRRIAQWAPFVLVGNPGTNRRATGATE